jgi:uncharacterized protein (DUF2336 family)
MDRMTSGTQALMAELDASLANRSDAQRSAMLRQVCDLFLMHAGSCRDAEVSIFDDVMMRLMGKLPREVLVELSGKLATVDNAPSNVIRRLADDNDIAIAGPLLRKSNGLTDRDLAAILAEKGAAHIKAIVDRGQLGPAVSDALIEQGDPETLRRLAANESVCFSEVGIVKLVYAAKDDQTLADLVINRKDLPAEMLPFLKMDQAG